MRKSIRFTLFILAALLISLVGLAACNDEKPQPDPPVQYTVTVTGDGLTAEQLAGIEAELFGGDISVGSKALDGGKATFSLRPATYTVKLNGVPAGYTYTAPTLTAEAPSATVTLTKLVTYSVTVTCDDAAVLAAVKVQLLRGEDIAAGPLSPTQGRADFSLPAGTYTVLLTGMPETYTYESATVTAQAPSVTLALTLQDERISYSVSVTCDNALAFTDLKAALYAQDGTLAAGPMALLNGRAVFKLLPATYTVELTGIALSDYTYAPATVSAEQPDITVALTPRPATGSGSEDDPFRLESLAGSYAVTPQKVTAGVWETMVAYLNVYYTYTEKTDTTYTLSTDVDYLTFFIEDGAGKSVLDWYDSFAGKSMVFTLKAGETYLLYAGVDDANSDTFEDGDELRWTIEEGTAQTKGDGTEEAPFILAALENDYTADTAAGQVYYRYTASETATYTVTTTIDFLSFYIEGVVTFDSSETKSKAFTLQKGETYLIIVEDFGGLFREVSFSIEKGGRANIVYSVSIEGLESNKLSGLKVSLVGEDGSKTEPKSPIIGNMVQFTVPAGTYTVEITGDLMAEYTFTSPTLTAEAPSATVTLTPKQTAGTPDSRWEGVGTVSDPYILPALDGEVTLQTKGATSYYFQYTAAEDGTYILTTESDNLYLSLTITPWVEGSTPIMWYGGDAAGLNREFKVFTGCKYTFEVKDSTGAGGEIQFKLEKKDLTQKVLSVKLGNDIPAFMGRVIVPDALFAQGDEATVTVTVKTGYQVATVKINGKPVALTDAQRAGAQFKFNVEDDTVVNVYFTAAARQTSDKSKTYYPALVGTWHNGTYGDLVIGADGTVTLDGKAATLTAAKSSTEEAPNQHEFSFTVTAGAQTVELLYNLEAEMYIAGQGGDMSAVFHPVIDWSGYVGTWEGDGMQLVITADGIAYEGEKLEAVAVYNADAGMSDCYVYLPAAGSSSKYVAYLLTVENGVLTLKADTTYSFTKA